MVSQAAGPTIGTQPSSITSVSISGKLTMWITDVSAASRMTARDFA